MSKKYIVEGDKLTLDEWKERVEDEVYGHIESNNFSEFGEDEKGNNYHTIISITVEIEGEER